MDTDARPVNFTARYEATLVPVIFTPWVRELIRRTALEDGVDVLDLACGTGAVSQEIVNSEVRPGSLTCADYNADISDIH